MKLLFVVLIVLVAAVWGASLITIRISGKELDMSFLGALIGAAGTIFAATIAYVAVQKQVDLAQQQAIDSEAQRAKWEKQTNDAAMQSAKISRSALAETLRWFDGISDQDQDRYRDTMMAMFRAGALNPNLPAASFDSFPQRTTDFAQRMNALRYQLEVTYNQNPDPSVLVANQDWKNLNSNVRDAVRQGRALLADLDAAIATREAKLN